MTRRTLLAAVGGVFAAPLLGTTQLRIEPPDAVAVSLIRLIATPERYDGRRVRVLGYLAYGGGLDRAVGLYLSEQDGKNAVLLNLVSVEIGGERVRKFLDNYVIFNATFESAKSHLRNFEGTGRLVSVSDLALWKTGDMSRSR